MLKQVTRQLRRKRLSPPEGAASSADPTAAKKGKPPSPGRRLLRSGIFDREFYATAVGKEFPTALAAAEHCVSFGLPERISPNPLLDPAYLPTPVQKSWQRGRVGATLVYLKSVRGCTALLGPLFDAGQVSMPEVGFGRGGALAAFLANVQDDTRLPVPGGYRGAVSTYGEARQRLLQSLRDSDLRSSGALLAQVGARLTAPHSELYARAHIADSAPRLRWGIKLPSTLGPIGDLWGDTHFAESLATALRGLGQKVSLYRYGEHHTSTSHLDDVVLGIRGLRPIAPIPGKLNIMWVISHPDDVTPRELSEFDLVFAASTSWSRRMSERLGRTVYPLLQATDVRRRPSSCAVVGDGSTPVFVGGNHVGRTRKIVRDAMVARLDIALFGPGWSGLVAESTLRGPYVANFDLQRLYRAHGLVLADHWSDMATEGFVANRLFDAVSAGARVISDRVEGISELFHGAVQVYDGVDELRYLCSPEGRKAFPDDAALQQISQEIAERHSFDQRAAVLLKAAAESTALRDTAGWALSTASLAATGSGGTGSFAALGPHA